MKKIICVLFLLFGGCATVHEKTAVIIQDDKNGGIIHFVEPYNIDGCGPQKVKRTDDGVWIKDEEE